MAGPRDNKDNKDNKGKSFKNSTFNGKGKNKDRVNSAPSGPNPAYNSSKTPHKAKFQQSTATVSAPSASTWWSRPHAHPQQPLVVLPEGARWFDEIPDLTAPTDTTAATGMYRKGEHRPLPREQLTAVLTAAPVLFAAEVKAHAAQKAAGSDDKWLASVMKGGTLTDKVAALALQVQESPLHNLEALDALVEMAGRKEQQRTVSVALEALKDLLLHNLLPDNRRLSPFPKQPLAHPLLCGSDARLPLLLWFEGQLAVRVGKVVDALEATLRSGSAVDHFKKSCMALAAELLAAKPEQEVRLLALLVSKVGDASAAVSSKASELLRQLVKRHSAMKLVVVRAVRSLVQDPKIAPRSLFAGAVFLSQVPLVAPVGGAASVDSAVASELVDCYVGLFEAAVGPKVKEDATGLGSRLLAVLLNGINHAYACCGNAGRALDRHMDALYRLVHTASFATATQALMLLSHAVLGDEVGATSSATAGVDRYYRALYDQLLSEQVTTRSKNTLFLNLLYRSLKRDANAARVCAFVKRLCLCATQSSPSIAAGLLLLVSEICKASEGRVDAARVVRWLTEEVPLPRSRGSDLTAEEGDTADDRGFFDQYDATKRDAAFALPAADAAVPGSAGVALWELDLLLHHFHPSVRAFARSLLGSDPSVSPELRHQIVFSGDPIVEFSLTGFLNRLSYKNPKKKAAASGANGAPVNMSQEFAAAPSAVVAPDKVFFHKFFGVRAALRSEGKSRDRSRHKGRGQGADGDSDSEDYEGEGEDEDEGAMDAFADRLAKGMLKANRVDIDDDSDFAGEGEEGGEDSDAGSEDFDFDGEGSDDDDEEGGGGGDSVFAEKYESDDDEEGEGGGYQLQTYGDEEDDDDDGDDEGSGFGTASVGGKRKFAAPSKGQGRAKATAAHKKHKGGRR